MTCPSRLFGLIDEGGYFKSEKTKKTFENKIPLTERHGRGVGINHYLYPHSDIIEVDTKEGVLYCVQFKSSLENK